MDTIRNMLLALSLLLAMPALAQDAAPETEAEAEDAVEVAEAVAPADVAATAEAPVARDPAAMDPAPADPALLPVFKAFGEEAGLVALVDDFMVRLLADPRTKRFFAESDTVAVKKHLVEQFCVILGGPCTYTGRDMRTSHAGFDIDRAAMNALVEDLQIAMDARGIPFRAQNELLAKLAPMHRDIQHR